MEATSLLSGSANQRQTPEGSQFQKGTRWESPPVKYADAGDAAEAGLGDNLVTKSIVCRVPPAAPPGEFLLRYKLGGDIDIGNIHKLYFHVAVSGRAHIELTALRLIGNEGVVHGSISPASFMVKDPDPDDADRWVNAYLRVVCPKYA